ncbi:hypothetical protein ACWKSP_21880 [Micromonosporaceae bacterium Da 78-11]
MSKVKWITGATLLASTWALAACEADNGAAPAPTVTTGVTSASPSASPSAGSGVGSAPATSSPAPSPSAATSSRPATASPVAAVLSGKREVAIVRVQAFESGVALVDDELTEVDDDSGRQSFVPTPLGQDKYLIKAYAKADDHPASDEPTCLKAYSPGGGKSLVVQGAVCATGDRDQQFTIKIQGKGAYAISNEGAFLQLTKAGDLILEELGDSPLRSTFRFVDNGPARRPAGG